MMICPRRRLVHPACAGSKCQGWPARSVSHAAISTHGTISTHGHMAWVAPSLSARHCSLHQRLGMLSALLSDRRVICRTMRAWQTCVGLRARSITSLRPTAHAQMMRSSSQVIMRSCLSSNAARWRTSRLASQSFQVPFRQGPGRVLLTIWQGSARSHEQISKAPPQREGLCSPPASIL